MNDELKKYFGNLGTNNIEYEYIFDQFKDKFEYKKDTIEMTESKKKRQERRKKLKRIFNYDDEMSLLNSFFKLKSKDIINDKLKIDVFFTLCKSMFVDSEQVSDVVFEYFMEETTLKEKLRKLNIIKQQTNDEIAEIEKALDEFENNDEEDEEDYLYRIRNL